MAIGKPREYTKFREPYEEAKKKMKDPVTLYGLDYRRGKKHEICPRCGKRRFLPYINRQTGEPLVVEVTEKGEKVRNRLGRCERIYNCGYHEAPDTEKYSFLPNPWIERETCQAAVWNTARGEQTSTKPVFSDYFDTLPLSGEELRKIRDARHKSGLYRFLTAFAEKRGLLSDLERVAKDYNLGANKENAVVFFQQDLEGKMRTAKIMWHDAKSGKRLREGSHGYPKWAHNEMGGGDFSLRQCPFGLHLLKKYPKKRVMVVESEKSAVIMSLLVPKYTWIATGGLANFSASMIGQIPQKELYVFADLGRGEKEWKNKTAVLNKAFTSPKTFHFVDWTKYDWSDQDFGENNNLIPNKEGDDIADFMLFFIHTLDRNYQYADSMIERLLSQPQAQP